MHRDRLHSNRVNKQTPFSKQTLNAKETLTDDSRRGTILVNLVYCIPVYFILWFVFARCCLHICVVSAMILRCVSRWYDTRSNLRFKTPINGNDFNAELSKPYRRIWRSGIRLYLFQLIDLLVNEICVHEENRD